MTDSMYVCVCVCVCVYIYKDLLTKDYSYDHKISIANKTDSGLVREEEENIHTDTHRERRRELWVNYICMCGLDTTRIELWKRERESVCVLELTPERVRERDMRSDYER